MATHRFPAALRAPITDLASGKAWIRALIAAELAFHFEDDPADCLDGVISPRHVPTVRRAVAALYALEWGPEPGMGRDYCPIGYMMWAEGFNAENQAEGFAPGASLIDRAGGLVLLDAEHVAGREYSAPGAYEVRTDSGALVSKHNTADEARDAHPALAQHWATRIAALRRNNP